MRSTRLALSLLLVVSCAVVVVLGCAQAASRTKAASPALAAPKMEKRWLFVWRDMSNPAEIDRMIARFPRAQADGYNGVMFEHSIAPEKAAELKAAARKYGLKLVVTVMSGSRNRNNVEGVLSKDALFVAHSGTATFQPDNPTVVKNGGFEEADGNGLAGWTLQDDPGVTTFVDREVKHSGQSSVRMEEIGKNQYRHCRVAQPLALQPHRQYRVSVWVKTENMRPADPEVKVLTPDSEHGISFQTFRVAPTQDWRQVDIVFNSLGNTQAMLYLGSWSGKSGKVWFDDLTVEEIGLVNVLRRPGTPLTVKGENGVIYTEGKDYKPVADPNLNPWRGYHEPAPQITLTAGSRIQEGQRLRVSFYHPVIIYDERLTFCVSEPSIMQEWKQEVARVNDLLHPDAFMMSHDEMRVINQCALCQSRHMTPGQLLADNVRKSAEIIRAIRPDAEIWVWNDMFDPMHNAVPSGYYLVNGPLTDSWKGLPKYVGIVNWNGGLEGKNCPFFEKLGLRQILSGYYDGDEDGSGIAKWEANTKDVKGIVGAMYTTWEDKYDAMDAWAKAAWGGK